MMEELNYFFGISLSLVLICLDVFFIHLKKVKLYIESILLIVLLCLLYHIIFTCPAILFFRIIKGVSIIFLILFTMLNINRNRRK